MLTLRLQLAQKGSKWLTNGSNRRGLQRRLDHSEGHGSSNSLDLPRCNSNLSLTFLSWATPATLVTGTMASEKHQAGNTKLGNTKLGNTKLLTHPLP